MARGQDPAPTTSINPTDQTSKRGVSAANPTAIVFPPPPARGVCIVPDEPGGTKP